jgi:hypothetical protein
MAGFVVGGALRGFRGQIAHATWPVEIDAWWKRSNTFEGCEAGRRDI